MGPNCAPHSFVHHSFFTSLTLIVNQFKSLKSCERIFFSHLKKKISSVIYIPYIHWISTRGQCVQCVRFDVTGFVRAKKHTKRNDKEWVCVQIRPGENLIIAWMWSFYLFFLHPLPLTPSEIYFGYEVPYLCFYLLFTYLLSHCAIPYIFFGIMDTYSDWNPILLIQAEAWNISNSMSSKKLHLKKKYIFK